MKRYAVFSNEDYYPAGGWSDFDDWFDDLEKARALAAKREKRKLWAHIVDLTTGKLVDKPRERFGNYK